MSGANARRSRNTWRRSSAEIARDLAGKDDARIHAGRQVIRDRVTHWLTVYGTRSHPAGVNVIVTCAWALGLDRDEVAEIVRGLQRR